MPAHTSLASENLKGQGHWTQALGPGPGPSRGPGGKGPTRAPRACAVTVIESGWDMDSGSLELS
eukprot:1059783-Rhodomonas_salina.1